MIGTGTARPDATPAPPALPALTVLALIPSAATAADGPRKLKLKPRSDFSPLGEREALERADGLALGAHEPARRDPRKPSMASKAIGKLRWNTEDGLPEVYLVLESRVDDRDEVWLKIRIPQRPNGHRLGARGADLQPQGRHDAPDHRPDEAAATLRKGGKVDLDVADRGRRAGHADAGREVLDPRAAAQPRREPRLRALGVRHGGVLEAVGLAGRRCRGHPRHQPARAHPRPPVARLRPRAERADLAARDGSCRSARRS